MEKNGGEKGLVLIKVPKLGFVHEKKALSKGKGPQILLIFW